MRFAQSASIIVSLTLFLLPPAVLAQSNTADQNLTLQFFHDAAEDLCTYSSSNNALTFTTKSIPILYHCFDFVDLFNGNITQGFVNQTSNVGPGVSGEAGIHWQILNADKFDEQGNYSRVLYRQHVADPPSDEYKPGHYAARKVTVYPGPGCSEKDPSNNETLLPWYGFSCWSKDEGSCGTLPYKVASFVIHPGQDDDKRDGTCWEFAKLGAAVLHHPSPGAIVTLLASATLALWLAV